MQTQSKLWHLLSIISDFVNRDNWIEKIRNKQNLSPKFDDTWNNWIAFNVNLELKSLII